MQTVFVAEIVPSQNKGEAALMWGIVRSIREKADKDTKFYLCSETYEDDHYEYGNDVDVIDHPGLVPVSDSASWKLRYFIIQSLKHMLFVPFYYLFGKFSLLFFRNKLWKAYYEADVIVVGHDNAFSKFHLPLILYSKLLRKKVAVYGSTIMPVVLNTDLIRKFARWTLNQVDLITTRENLTYEHLQSIGVNKAPLYHTADKAFILEPTSEDEVKQMCSDLGLTDLKSPVIGVMIVKGSTVFKAAFKDQDLSPQEKYDKHISEIAKTMDNVAERLNATLVFMPHCIGPGENLDDRVCARHVHEKMSKKSQVILLEEQL
ncbi:MAG: polysaccharide pyruvyl transferase family protein, partial [Gammaproteobacteria bacterium]|nr:polysaccharide pyruvyl transferase family protein [Gammaproteobacteria bacterium]